MRVVWVSWKNTDPLSATRQRIPLGWYSFSYSSMSTFASCTSRPIGFSEMTCLPAAQHLRTRVGWTPMGSTMTTAAMLLSPRMAARPSSPKCSAGVPFGKPPSSAALESRPVADASERDHTAVMSKPGTPSSAGTYALVANRPEPSSAARTGVCGVLVGLGAGGMGGMNGEDE